MLPRVFRRLWTLRVLNALAVGCSLASLTGAALSFVFNHDSTLACSSSVSTFVAGAIWTLLFRLRRRIGKRRIRVGWVAAIPLAASNAAGAIVLAAIAESHGQYLLDLVPAGLLAATAGVIIWLPALLVTVVLFGLPLVRAQSLAERGLAGEERGERVVGSVSALLGACGVLLNGGMLLNGGQLLKDRFYFGPRDSLVPLTLAFPAILFGAIAALLALARERDRRRFIADVEKGLVDGYRVSATTEGKVLMRVANPAQPYRGEQHQALLALDEEGNAVASIDEGPTRQASGDR
jgi:hypothetical protein